MQGISLSLPCPREGALFPGSASEDARDAFHVGARFGRFLLAVQQMVKGWRRDKAGGESGGRAL